MKIVASSTVAFGAIHLFECFTSTSASCVPAGLNPVSSEAKGNKKTWLIIASGGLTSCIRGLTDGNIMPRDFIFTIEPASTDAAFDFAVYTLPTNFHDVMNHISPVSNPSLLGVNPKTGTGSRFPPGAGPFGVVIQVPAANLQRVTIWADLLIENWQIRLSPGFTNLSEIEIVTEHDDLSPNGFVTLEADVTSASAPVKFNTRFSGLYKIKGDVSTLITRDDILTPTNMAVDGNVGSAKISGKGMYNVTGKISGSIRGSAPEGKLSGVALLNTPNCSSITAPEYASCIEDASPLITPFNMSCMVDTCALKCEGNDIVTDCSGPANSNVEVTQNTTSDCPSLLMSVTTIAGFTIVAVVMLMGP